jgi:hypothetical protein
VRSGKNVSPARCFQIRLTSFIHLKLNVLRLITPNSGPTKLFISDKTMIEQCDGHNCLAFTIIWRRGFFNSLGAQQSCSSVTKL